MIAHFKYTCFTRNECSRFLLVVISNMGHKSWRDLTLQAGGCCIAWRNTFELTKWKWARLSSSLSLARSNWKFYGRQLNGASFTSRMNCTLIVSVKYAFVWWRKWNIIVFPWSLLFVSTLLRQYSAANNDEFAQLESCAKLVVGQANEFKWAQLSYARPNIASCKICTSSSNANDNAWL